MVKFHFSKKSFLLTGGVVAAVAALLLGVYLVGHKKTASTSGKVVNGALTAEQKKAQSTSQPNISQRLANKQYDQARDAIRKLYPDAQQQQLALAQVSVKQQDYKRAAGEYQQYEAQYGATLSTTEALAQVYEQMGDKSNAAAYYQKAADLVAKSKGLGVDAEVKRLQAKAQALQK